ncbi:adhesion regulating molecule [Exidia glandulosa HHB12029]|uniref:Adhesion regulating molecule n=1 Tax=Exidia glandulosa HHB12029 TaxID=1314781 RepID=A0A165K4P7_EXIGL|nr:adhesion regulating molecule [Exidia glandulosa HHB12029]
MSAPTVAFKAGRLFRRGDTNWVDPQPEKGVVLVTATEDGLIQWQWKNRTTNALDEDLLIFPSDTTFSQVAQSAWGRTYVLAFSSSDQKHFDASSARDDQIVHNVNGVLQDASFEPTWSTPAASSSSAAAAGSSRDDTLRRLREILTRGGSASAAGLTVEPPSVALSDVLTPANLAPIFADEALARSLFPFLPADLPSPPTPATLQQVVSSPQFQAAVRELDRALSTGLLADLVRGLGLPASAGESAEAFIRAVAEQAGSGGEERMDTD